MAWPERIVAALFGMLIIFGAEIALMIVMKENRVSGWIAGPTFILAVFLDIWLILRIMDRAMAGPARRKRDRVVKFSP